MSKPIPFRAQLFRIVTRTLAWPVRVAAHRRVLRDLSGFDDRELADIGLSRQDLRDVTALPLSVDPTDLLADRARARAEASLRAPSPSTPPAAAVVPPSPYRIAAE